MRKKIVLISTILSFFIILSIIIVISSKLSVSKSSLIDKSCWALYNYGQTVNDSVGVSEVDINIRKAWELCEQSYNEIIVGVVDSGVDYSLKSLTEHLWVNDREIPDNLKDDDENGYEDDYYGWDFYNGDSSIYDGYLYDYHGTYISDMIVTVAPNVKIISSKFLKGTQGDVGDCVSAVRYAIENGADIINCSWCFEEDETELYKLMAENKDILFVCAAGNSRLNLDEISVYPACYDLDNVISVMAIDNAGEIYDVSGYGSTVDIAAPGKDILVTMPEGDETYVDGTSIAAAFVSATAALMKSYNPELSPNEMKSIMIETAQKLDSLKGMCKSEGCVDIYNALNNCK